MTVTAGHGYPTHGHGITRRAERMFVYEKKLQYPVKIKQTNPKLAKIIITQYGGLYCKKIYIYYYRKIPLTGAG